MSKRVLITLPDETYKIIKSIETLGTSDADKIRSIVISWLSEKSLISTKAKQDMKG